MTTAEILARFRDLKALVVGDICLDRWCRYDPALAEPSRETGIPRIAVVATETTAGAGGTIANNLQALGAGEVAVLGVIGNDGFGWELRQALARRHIRDLCVTGDSIPTFTYTKLINGPTGVEDRPRVDFVFTEPLPAALETQITTRLTEVVAAFDVILVSDQAETNAGGVVTPAVRERLTQLADQYPAKVFWVDSRLRAEHFRKLIVKPNEREAAEACGRLFGVVNYVRLRQKMEAPLLIVTHGPRGALIVAGEETWVPTKAIENPVDICGAGDSFSAGAALTLAATGDVQEACRIGNLVTSVTIMKPGTGTASPEEVLAAEAR